MFRCGREDDRQLGQLQSKESTLRVYGNANSNVERYAASQ
eukprot:gene27062-biopygen17626